jgi:hypothetical protein
MRFFQQAKRFFKRLLGLVIGLLLLIGLWLMVGVWWPLTVPQPNPQPAQLLLIDVERIAGEGLFAIPGPLRRLWLSDAEGMARRAGEGGQQSYMDFYRFGIQQTGIAQRAGVTVLAGSDAPDSFAFPGSALHDELDHLVKAGLSPLEALRSATLEPARFLDLEGQAGVIRPGARADIVLLRKNPLDDIGAVRDIETVILAGAVYDREDLENLLAGVESAAGSWTMWPRFTWQILNSPIMRKQFGD